MKSTEPTKTKKPTNRLPSANGDGKHESKPVGFTPIKYQLRRAIVVVEGLEPGLLMNSKQLMVTKAGSKSKGHMAPDIECELRCHWVGEGKNKTLAFPWLGFYNAIVQAGNNFKWRGRQMMGSALGPTLACSKDMISLGTSEYRPYRAWVCIPPKTGAMVEIDRPLVFPWKAEIELIIDDGTPQPVYAIDLLPEIINEAGRMVGIGANRPAKKGPNGKFQVVEWRVIE